MPKIGGLLDIIVGHTVLWLMLAVVCSGYIVYVQLSVASVMLGVAAKVMSKSTESSLSDGIKEGVEPFMSKNEIRTAARGFAFGVASYGLAWIGATVFGILFLVSALANIFS